ncbi:MAG: hypothetical protein ACI4EU_08385 [Butyrivibrio sp.]
MMKFIPKYTVSYKGIWHNAGEKFDISPEDAEELRQHGEIIKDEPSKPEEKKAAARANTQQKKN